MDSRENKKNILWINYLKALSIIGVYFVHCETYYNWRLAEVNLFIHPFYVNAFFFVSGYLLFRKQLSVPLINQRNTEYVIGGGKALIFNILWRLVVPSILFSIVEFFPSHILRGHSFDAGTFMYKTIGGCTYWFTSALVVAELLVVGMLFTRIRNVWFYLAGCCAFFALGHIIVANSWSIIEQYPSLPWQYKQGLYAIVFMGLGGVYWKYETFINRWMNWYTLFGMIGLYAVCLVLWPHYFRVLVSKLVINVPGIAISLLATIILIVICKKIPFSTLLNYVGQNTIGFYFMSGALPIVISMEIQHLMPESNAVGFVIVFSGSVGISFMVVYIMNRFFPWLLDLRLLWKKKT